MNSKLITLIKKSFFVNIIIIITNNKYINGMNDKLGQTCKTTVFKF